MSTKPEQEVTPRAVPCWACLCYAADSKQALIAELRHRVRQLETSDMLAYSVSGTGALWMGPGAIPDLDKIQRAVKPNKKDQVRDE